MNRIDSLKLKIKKFFEWLQKKEERIEDFLTAPRTVRISTILAIVIYFSTLAIAVIVAQFDPDRYNIIINYISDLGSFRHTPLPYFFDYGAMITAILLIPPSFYIEKKSAPIPRNPEHFQEYSQVKFRLASLGFLCMIIGAIGLFGIGLFSEDRTTPLGLHTIFSYIVFGGFVITGIFFGLLITFYSTMIPRLLGIYMIFGPSIMAILFLIKIPPSRPFWEWILLFSLFIWMIPVSIIIIKNASKELISR